MQNKKKIILIASIGLIVLAFAIFALYFSMTPAPEGQPSALREFFTFGRTVTPTQAPTPTTPGANNSGNGQNQGSGTITNPIALKQLTKNSVAGATALYIEQDKPITPPATDPNANPVLEWSRNLTLSDTGQDVKELQQFLNLNLEPKDAETTTSTQIAKTGAGSPGNETTTFGPATKNAVIVFQEKFKTEILTPQNLSAGTGTVDEKTRQKIHELKSLIPQKESVVALRYIDEQTGTVQQLIPSTGEEKRISETKIPKIHEAFFASAGNTALLRYLKEDNQTIETFSATIPTISEGGDSSLEITGSFLPENISSLAVSPDGTKIFYLTASGNGVIGTIATPTGASRTQPFSSAFTEWNTQWVNARIIVLTTKASALVPGYIYTFDTQTKEFNKVLGGVPGLTTLVSPNGKKILYSRAIGTNFTLSLYDTDTKKSTDLGINTLPEKCVWSPDNIIAYCAVPNYIARGAYPDLWYQGVVSFADSIWKLDTQTSLFKTLSNPKDDAGVELDGTNLFLDGNEQHVFFTNKKDGTLWSVALSAR